MESVFYGFKTLNNNKMTQEQEIKGILVNFFREGTNGDYLNALNTAIKEIEQVKNCSIPDVVNCDRPRAEKLKDKLHKDSCRKWNIKNT